MTHPPSRFLPLGSLPVLFFLWSTTLCTEKKMALPRSHSSAKVTLDLSAELDGSELDAPNTKELADVIRTYWERYLHMDRKSIEPILAADVRKMTQINRKLSHNSAEFVKNLTGEWEEFERPGNILALQLNLREINFWADDRKKPTMAIAYYWMEMEGGARWEFDDQGLVVQAFRKEKDRWKMVHYMDALGTDYDLEEDDYGDEPDLLFEYVYPVKDVRRAVDFYRPLLGDPDYVTESQAYFGLRDPGFFLDSAGLEGYARPEKNKTNGYALVRIQNLAAEIPRLKKRGVVFLAGTDESLRDWGPDKAAIIRDLDGNVLVLLERRYESKNIPPVITGFGESPAAKLAETIAQAWMKKDADTLGKLHPDGLWFDNSRLVNRGLQEGSKDIAQNLKEAYWKHLDHSAAGVSAEWAARNLKEGKLGGYTIVSYERLLTGRGNHPVRSRSFITHIIESPQKVALTMINNATVSDAIVNDLDYTGHPVRNVKKAQAFYTADLGWSEPYSDDYWRGFWSDNSVYGLFEAVEGEGLLTPDKTNGYVSFSIASAEKTYNYLKGRSASFPIIPSVNTRAGIDPKPGYTQVVTVDSEGNVVIFTEYTGRRR